MTTAAGRTCGRLPRRTMNDNKNPFPFAGANMPPLGFEQMERMKREIKRRFAFFGAGLIVVIVGAFLDAKALSLPLYAPSMVMLGGGALAFMGLLGMSRGAGCMAQIAVVLWFLSLACGVGESNPLFGYTMAGAALCFAVLGLLLPKKQNPGIPGLGAGGAGGFPGFPFGQGAGGAGGAGPQLQGQRPAKDRIIEVDAEEKR